MTEPSRTTVEVDDALLAAAAGILGTSGAEATVRAALERVVRGRRFPGAPAPERPGGPGYPGVPPFPNGPGPEIPYPGRPRPPNLPPEIY